MCNDRLSHLRSSAEYVKSNILREVNFEDLVTEFAKMKARKLSLL